jgi:hypothetical protein
MRDLDMSGIVTPKLKTIGIWEACADDDKRIRRTAAARKTLLAKLSTTVTSPVHQLAYASLLSSHALLCQSMTT